MTDFLILWGKTLCFIVGVIGAFGLLFMSIDRSLTALARRKWGPAIGWSLLWFTVLSLIATILIMHSKL